MPSMAGSVVCRFKPPHLTQRQPRLARSALRRNLTVGSNKPDLNEATAAAQLYPNVDGSKITPEELSSLNSFLSSRQVNNGQDLEHLLGKGSSRGIQDLSQLEGAMLFAEQVHLGNFKLDSISPPAPTLQDTPVWQPIFASSGGVPRLLYIPVPEYFDLSAGDNLINIVTLLGPLVTHFSGSCSWKGGEALDYCISRLDFQLGKAVFGFGLPGPLQLKNTLTFFFASEACVCARSKLGGTMLLVPQPQAWCNMKLYNIARYNIERYTIKQYNIQ